MTWSQLAEKLGISVSMIMMVKRGQRNLSAKAVYRLEQAERETLARKSRAEGVVDQILRDEGKAADIIDRLSQRSGRLDFQVEYSGSSTDKSLPKKVNLCRPPEQGCAKLRQLFAETLDTKVVLLACLTVTFRSENYLAQLSPDSRVRLTNGAMTLVVPDWRDIVANSVVDSK